MAHHGQGSGPINNEIFKRLKESVSELALHHEEILGDTGQYPEGALSSDDEGELRYAIGSKGDKVIIDFGKPTAWVGMTADQAIETAMTLVRHASRVKGIPMSVRIGQDE